MQVLIFTCFALVIAQLYNFSSIFTVALENGDLLATFYDEEQMKVTTRSKLSPKDQFDISLKETVNKMNNAAKDSIIRDIPYEKMNLVICHITRMVPDKDSVDLSFNNIKIFVSAVMDHGHKYSDPFAFYIFNVADGHNNGFLKLLPANQTNVGIIHWPGMNSEKDTPIKTLMQLGPDILSLYSAVFFTSDRNRGPLYKASNGQWIEEFRYLLDQNNVGIVGASFSCDSVQGQILPHMFAFRVSIIDLLHKNMDKRSVEAKLLKLGVEKVAKALRFRRASILYFKRFNQLVFKGMCPSEQKQHHVNPTFWCDVYPEEVIFYKWGGITMRPPIEVCDKQLKILNDLTEQLANEKPHLKIRVPESLTPGPQYDFVHDFNYEMYRDTIAEPLRRFPAKTAMSTKQVAVDSRIATIAYNVNKKSPKVCVFAEVKDVYFPTANQRGSTPMLYYRSMIEDFYASLLRQVNQNFRVYFYVTELELDSRLLVKLKQFMVERGDVRFEYIEDRPMKMDKVSVLEWLGQQLVSRDECSYGTLSMANTIFGSDVVRQVISVIHPGVVGAGLSNSSTSSSSASHLKDRPDIILIPFDSKVTAQQELIEKYNEITETVRADEYCAGIRAIIETRSVQYSPREAISPREGRLEMTAAFFKRKKFFVDNGKIDNVEFPVELNDVIVQESDLDDKCLGCREGFIVYWLITHNGWTHLQLTPDGLKSIVFVDPSPTWCIANGKVWFDLPNHKKTGCLFREAIKGMSKRDDPKLPSFDWVQLRVTSHVCLRLTEAGLADLDTVIPV